jgi:hypothetical protein
MAKNWLGVSKIGKVTYIKVSGSKNEGYLGRLESKLMSLS